MKRAALQPPAAIPELEPAVRALAEAQTALARAQENHATARARLESATAAEEAAAAELRNASGGLAHSDDPLGEKLFDDATRALLHAQARVTALRDHTLPAAESAVTRCGADLAEAAAEHEVATLRAAVLDQVLPADQAFYIAAQAAAEALAMAQEARRAVRTRFRSALPRADALSPGGLALGVPSDLAQLTTARVDQGPFTHNAPVVTKPITGQPAQALASLLALFNLDAAECSA